MNVFQIGIKLFLINNEMGSGFILSNINYHAGNCNYAVIIRTKNKSTIDIFYIILWWPYESFILLWLAFAVWSQNLCYLSHFSSIFSQELPLIFGVQIAPFCAPFLWVHIPFAARDGPTNTLMQWQGMCVNPGDSLTGGRLYKWSAQQWIFW